MKKTNFIEVNGDIAYVLLGGKCKVSGRYALIDVNDIENIKDIHWINSKGYATGINRKTGKRVFMHRIILNVKKRIEIVDHVNRNTLDNRKSNLRVCSDRENSINRKVNSCKKGRYKGVYFVKSTYKFKASISVNGKQKHLGYFLEAIQAAKAYDEAAIKYFGKFACTNEMLGLYK